MRAQSVLIRSGFLLAIAFLMAPPGTAQATGNPAAGIESGNYVYQGSINLGGRFVDTKGSASGYNTFVNQQEGFRVLDQTLNIRSLNHTGVLFDNLFVTSYGWGGDPENGSRLRASKNK